MPPAINIIGTAKLLDLNITKDKIAILSIRTFDEDERAQAGLVFSTFLYRSFNRLKAEKINKLTIDLRGNGGRKPFSYYEKLVGSNAEKYRKTGNG